MGRDPPGWIPDTKMARNTPKLGCIPPVCVVKYKFPDIPHNQERGRQSKIGDFMDLEIIKPTKSLPENYHQNSTLDLSKDWRLAIILSILVTIALFVSGGIFLGLALILRHENEFGFAFIPWSSAQRRFGDSFDGSFGDNFRSYRS